jgi:flavin-binding protein dodecin
MDTVARLAIAGIDGGQLPVSRSPPLTEINVFRMLMLYEYTSRILSREGNSAMSVARVTEIISSSPSSFEDAIQSGIARAAETIHNIQGAWVKEQKVSVEGGKITEYRVDLMVTFILDE